MSPTVVPPVPPWCWPPPGHGEIPVPSHPPVPPLRVALVDLPTPDGAVFVTAARTVVLVDRRVPAARVRRLAQAAQLLAESALLRFTAAAAVGGA